MRFYVLKEKIVLMSEQIVEKTNWHFRTREVHNLKGEIHCSRTGWEHARKILIISKLDKPLADKTDHLKTGEERKKTRINIGVEEEISVDPMEIKSKIRGKCEQIYANKFYSLYELDQFLEKHSF